MSGDDNCEKSTKADADTLEQDRGSTKELGLEPAAFMEKCDNCGFIECAIPSRTAYAQQGNVDACENNEIREEPLVRLSDVNERIEAHLVEAQRQKQLISNWKLESENPEEVYQGWVLVESVLKQIQQELTQKGGSD